MIRIYNAHFVDEHGRMLLLRGVNLGGTSKIPFTPRVELSDPRFYDDRNVSFVGRPFPLDEADEHFTRLREWGLTFLRFVVTWEAIEHAAPREYDTEFLDYVSAVIKKAGEYGFQILIDPHQDVWSRFTGGSGAPAWTLEVVGFDVTKLRATGAALLHDWNADRPPLLIWWTNYGRLAPATLFTLFFAGNEFAPETKINGSPAQEFLQQHYLDAFAQLALRLRGMPHVIGYEVMNEPSRGYIGWKNLRSSGQFKYWPTPSPYQAMLLGSGYPQRVWLKMTNVQGERVWLPGHECLWKQNGVWDVDSRGRPQLLRPAHFARGDGNDFAFRHDFYPRFAARFAETIREIDPRALIFIQGEPGEPAPRLNGAELPNMVYAPHWYDGLTLMVRRYLNHLGADMLKRRIVIGSGAIQRSFAAQLNVFRHEAQNDLGGVPVLLGEFGVPFDLHNKTLLRAADELLTTRALDRSFRALDANVMGGTLWNYSADNVHGFGDAFNGEDLSIFCRSEQKDPSDIHSGGRALRAVVRPYPRATAGTPLTLQYDWFTHHFEYEFRHDSNIRAPTEIFVPEYPYKDGFLVRVSDGSYERRDRILIYYHDPQNAIHRITIQPAGDVLLKRPKVHCIFSILPHFNRLLKFDLLPHLGWLKSCWDTNFVQKAVKSDLVSGCPSLDAISSPEDH